MECAESICERTSDGGEGPLRADHALLDSCVADGAFEDHRSQFVPVRCVWLTGLRLHGVEDGEHHRLHDEAVVVVPVKVWTVAVSSVTDIPLLMLRDSVV